MIKIKKKTFREEFTKIKIKAKRKLQTCLSIMLIDRIKFMRKHMIASESTKLVFFFSSQEIMTLRDSLKLRNRRSRQFIRHEMVSQVYRQTSLTILLSFILIWFDTNEERVCVSSTQSRLLWWQLYSATTVHIQQTQFLVCILVSILINQ